MTTPTFTEQVQSQRDLPPRFRFESILGSGGFGQVCHVYDTHREAHVALKTLKKQDAQALLYFKEEFRSLTHMIHPNLVTLYELISHEEMWFFTMELLHGSNYLQHVRHMEHQEPTVSHQLPTVAYETDEGLLEMMSSMGKSISFEEQMISLIDEDPGLRIPLIGSSEDTLDIAWDEELLRHSLKQLYLGITALHKEGMLHRDIKPSNVMVTPDKRVVLLDFGLISEVKSSLTLTKLASTKARPSRFVGTPHYMSPEQAIGNTLTPASDWYSIGAMLYEIFTARHPIEGGSAVQILLKKQTAQPLPVRELNGQVPEDLATLCMGLLARDPKDRPDAQEIAKTLGVTPDEAPPLAPTSKELGARQARFVNRTGCLTLMNKRLAAFAKGNRAQMIKINGPSGVGKTALMNHFLGEHLDPTSSMILKGRCFENEQVSYKLFDQLIDMLSQKLQVMELIEVMPLLSAEGAALIRLFPTLGRVPMLAEVADLYELSTDAEQLRLDAFNALHQLLSHLGRTRSLILAIDDIQWGDADSIALLQSVLRSPAPKITFLVTARTDIDNGFMRVFQDLCNNHGNMDLVEVDLHTLDEQATEEMIQALLLPKTHSPEMYQAQLESIKQESEGHPLFIDELTRFANLSLETLDASSIDLNVMLQQRVQALTPVQQRMLEFVSLSNHALERTLLRTLSGAGEQEPQAIAELKRFCLLQTDQFGKDQTFRPYHDRIKHVVLQSLSSDQAAQAHQDLAKALSSRPQHDAARVAEHFLASLEPSQAVPFLFKASDAAYESLAFAKAVDHLEQALELCDLTQQEQQPFMIRLGQLHSYLGQGAQAAQWYQRAQAVCESAHDAWALQRRAAEQLLRAGDYDQGAKLLQDVLAHSRIKTPKSNASIIGNIIMLRTKISMKKAPKQDAHQDPTPAQLARLEASWSASQLLSAIDLKYGAYFAAVHMLDAFEAQNADHISLSLALEAVHLSVTPKGFERAKELLDQAESYLPQVHATGYCKGFVAFGRGMLAFLQNHWKSALEYFEQAERILKTECTGVVWEVDGSRFYQYFCHERMGNHQHFVDTLPRWLNAAEQRQDNLYQTNWRLWAYRGFLAQDEPEEAMCQVNLAMEAWTQENYHIQHFWAVIARANIHLYANQPEEALAHIDEHIPKLKKAWLWRMEVVSCVIEDARCRALFEILLAKGSLDKKQHEKQKRALRKSITKLGQIKMPFRDMLASLLKMQLKVMEQGTTSALEELDTLINFCVEEDYMFHGRFAQLWRARINPEYSEQEGEILEELKAHGFSHPTKMLRLLIPLAAVG